MADVDFSRSDKEAARGLLKMSCVGDAKLSSRNLISTLRHSLIDDRCKKEFESGC